MDPADLKELRQALDQSHVRTTGFEQWITKEEFLALLNATMRYDPVPNPINEPQVIYLYGKRVRFAYNLDGSQKGVYTGRGVVVVEEAFKIRVERGDTLTQLAEEYSINWRDLLQVNPQLRPTPNILIAGDFVTIPAGALYPQ